MDNQIVLNKKILRKQILSQLKSQSQVDRFAKSEMIFQQIEHDFLTEAKVILAFWSMPEEVFTHDFILKWFKNKKILLPKVNGSTLDIKVFDGMENMLADNKYGILEPQGENFENLDFIDLILVPGLAFDKNLNRLGRGKGYYDGLLKNSNAKKIAVCYDFQIFENVPVEFHDIKVDNVIFA